MKIFLSASLLFFYFTLLAQTEVWRHSDTLGGIYGAQNINIDANNNLYVGGPSIDSLAPSGPSAALVFKLDSSGNYHWNQGFIFNNSVTYYGMAGDTAGNSYLYGLYNDSISSNAFLTRVNSSGSVAWTKHYSYQQVYDAFNSGMVDKDGNILIAGVSDDASGDQDLSSFKFSSADSTPLWNSTYTGPYSFYYCYFAQTDNAGGEYNLGQTYALDFGASIYLVKYNSTGGYNWAKLINSTPNSDEEPASTNADASGNLYIADNSSPSYTNFNYVPYVIKISPSGSIVWQTLLAADTAVNYILTSSALDADAFYIAGSRDDSIYIAKISAATGDTIWTFQYQWGSINKIILKNNAIYATGFTIPDTSDTGFFTIKLTTNGLMLWSATYNDTMNGADHAYDLIADNSGNIYVAGQSFETSSGGGSATVIKYHDAGFNCTLAVDSFVTTAANHNSSNGSAIAVLSGGASPYTFNWSSGASADTITGLGANLYCLTVTDAHGCKANLCDSVRPVPCNLNISSVIVADVSCYGAANGNITIYTAGSYGQVSYSIDSGAHFQADSMFGNLTAGVHYVEAKDANNCAAFYALNPVSINSAVADTPTIVHTNDTVSTGEYNKYNWYVDGNLVSTSPFLVSDGGNYCGDIYVQVTDYGGCIYNSSDFENVCMGINSLNFTGMELAVYPNPFSERLNGSWIGDITGNGVRLALLDVYGRLVYEDKAGGNTFSIPTSTLPQGMYILRLQAGEQFFYKQVIKVTGQP